MISKEAVQTSEGLLGTSVLGRRREGQTDGFPLKGTIYMINARIVPGCIQKAQIQRTPKEETNICGSHTRAKNLPPA
jgi:hypothetical protein